MAQIKFYRGLKATYKGDSTHKDGLYFALDTHELLMNGVVYGSDIQLASNKAVKNVEVAQDKTKLKITYTDNTTQEIQLSIYESKIEDKNLTMPNTVGGIAKGTKVSSLEGKNYSELFDDLLFPTVNPTFIAPSASLTFKGFNATVEVGVAGPTEANFNKGFNKGAINLNGVKQNDRSGNLIEGESFIFVNGSESDRTLPEKVVEGDTKFTYKATYEQGPQPKDNKGNNYQIPLPKGSVNSSQLNLNGTYPWYATTATSGTFTKQALIAWSASNMATPQFKLQPVGSGFQGFKLPRAVKTIQILNTLSGKFENDNVNNWTKSEESEQVNGLSRNYSIYKYNGPSRGEVTLKLTF